MKDGTVKDLPASPVMKRAVVEQILPRARIAGIPIVEDKRAN
jgi:hypothetical protein